MASQAIADTADGGPQEFLPLRAMSNALTALLLSTVVLTAVRLAVPVLTRGGPAWEASIDTKPLVILSRISALLTPIVFLVWLRRARINAERHAWPQRYARAWIFWGWLVPVANMWLPLQIMEDIWRAGMPGRDRTWAAWLPTLWWTCWLVATSFVLLPGGVAALELWSSQPSTPSSATSYGPRLPAGWPSFCFFAAAGLALTAIVRIVSNGQVGTPATPDPFDLQR